MISGSVVFYKIATTCLLILAGYAVKRLRLLPDPSLAVMSKYIIYVALPCYVLYYTPTSVDRESLAANWHFPILGFLLVMVADIFGYITARLWAGPGERGTFRMLVAMPNWVFMALAVCEPLFREDGVRVVLLYNIGITLYIWTFGMSSFKPASSLIGLARQLFVNLQSVAIVIGLVLAVTMPCLRGMEKLSSSELAALPLHLGLITPIWETIYLLACTAMPLSIFQIGLLLANPAEEGVTPPSDTRSVVVTSVLRLLVSPVLSIAVLVLLDWCGVSLTFNEFMVSVLIMAMAPAVLVISVVEVYGGPGRLAARGILWGSIAGLATAPVIAWVAQHVHAWMR